MAASYIELTIDERIELTQIDQEIEALEVACEDYETGSRFIQWAEGELATLYWRADDIMNGRADDGTY